MSLAAEYREEFPVRDRLIYLNHAAVSPLARRTADAMKQLAEEVALYGSLHYETWMEAYAGLRAAAARLIGASAEEIALVKNTSEGIATVALGFPWQAGDRVVAFAEEFPANFHPWARLSARGVEIRWLSIYDPLPKIAEAVQGARLLAISFVNYLSGYRVDVEQLGAICRDAGCFFFVDAIQGLGVYPLDVERCHIDALAADGHKWLLGPEGNGLLYVRREWQERIEPTEFGWTNLARYSEYTTSDTSLRPDAGRYECGTLNTVGCFGLRTAIELLLVIGVPRIRQAVDALAAQIAEGVRAKGYALMVDRTEGTGSGIVSFRHASVNTHLAVSQLKQQKILAASRQGWIRMAPHFYLTAEDIAQVLDCLPAV